MASIPLQSNILGASPIPNVKEDFLAGFSKVKKEQKPKGLKTFEETGMTVDDMIRKGLITTSEAMDRGLVNYTIATDEQMKPSYQMEAPKAPLQEGLVGKGLRALLKGPPAVNIPQKIAEPITGFIQSGQQELESRKQTRLEETDMKISQTIDELASEGYSEDQIMEVFADLDKEGFFKDKPGVIEGMSQRLYSSLSEGVSRGQKVSEVAQQNIAGESTITAGEISLAGGVNVLSTAVSAPFNAVFGGVIEAGMEKLPEPVKQKIVEAGEMYDQFAKENPRAGFNLRTAGDVVTVAPIPLAPIVTKPIKKYGEKVIKETITKTQESMASLKKGLQKRNAEKMKRMTDEGLEEIYQAVNPTTRENKAVLRQRVEDLLPYIDETKRFSNDLPTVKGRVDADKIKAFKDMEDYETNVGVKGQVDTDLVAKSIENKYMEKIGDSFINKTEAEIAKDLIDTLKGFGRVVKDADIVKIRRAWDKIIEKNKGFMQSADATSKGDIFADANKFFRDEIKKSNPEYAKYLEKAHKTITLSDILEATIQRRTGQSQGGFLRQGLENVARVAGTGIGAGVGTMVGSPAVGAMLGYGATEVLMEGVKKATGSSAKLTKGKKLLLKSKKNDSNTSNNPNSRTRPMEGEQGQKPSRSGLERKIPIEKKKPFSTKMEGVDYERIPGSKKMAKEYPYGKTVRLGEKEKKGVEVKGTPLLPAQSQTSQLARQKEIKSIKSSIASATQSAQFGGTGNTRVESKINNLLSENKITRDEALRILSDIQKSVDSGSNEFAYMNKGKLADYISEIKGGKKVVDEFDELLNKKPETKTPIVEKKTDKQIYDQLQEMANDGRFGEKSWNKVAEEFKKQTGVDVMDVTFDDFSEMGVLTKKKTGIQKKKGIVTPDKSENTPIAKKNGISAKMAENDQKGEKFRTAEDMNKAELTTKILKGLGDRETVSKEFIRNMTNSGDVKQVEKDIIRGLLESEGDKVNVADFKKKVQAELLPLKRVNNQGVKDLKSEIKKLQEEFDSKPDEYIFSERGQFLSKKLKEMHQELRQKGLDTDRYENVTLPDDLRGKVKDYQENIYESPIETSAGQVHFGGRTNKYFGHTRVEDMADGSTRRVIEVQSDLFQKGRLEQEGKFAKNLRKNPEWFNASEEMVKEVEKDFAKLSQYNDPTAHFRMIREEVAKAVEDGKKKLQFPTGETAMKIEGLGDTLKFIYKDEGMKSYDTVTPDLLKVGKEIEDAGDTKWIITDVLGDGKFKAIPKRLQELQGSNWKITIEGTKENPLYVARNVNGGMETVKFIPEKKEMALEVLKKRIGADAPDKTLAELSEKYGETFDISGKVDQNNPIFKFYEKEIGRYLKNKYDAKLVTDDKGVSWMQVDLKESMGGPVEAFRKGGIIPKSQMTDAQKMEITDLNQRFFGDDSLQIVDKIVSNEKALGSYRNGMIKIVDGQVNPTDTFYHESVHKYLDVFTTKDEAKAILEHGKAKYKDGDYVSVEEKIAEDFIKFAKDRSGVTGKVRIIFENILDRIKTYFGKGDKISQMYRDILKGKAKGKGIQPKGSGIKYMGEKPKGLTPKK